ncbi:armadillo-type protein [Suillus discolor]|uniref:Armadillo-type protein n=1 Tax=Suillus discolor TaxID=1912936 RepID=A0A9P7JSI1_9AGAM|nr:armadillo-type protein [Suillus discolor]KAG2105125.1 armadillo-type protein [Suillus discolor]
MADDSLIVPVLLANGSLHHPSVASDALAQDIIGVLTTQEEVISSILGELQDTGWALQHVCSQPNGRKWEEAELEALGDGIIDPSTPIAPLLKQSNYPVTNASQRHFSTFPLTSHLHSPTLRLVSLHAALSLSLSFVRVPEIHDGFTWTVYYARSSIVEDVIRFVVEDLGLTKSLPMAGGGNLEYIIQDGASRISSSSVLSDLVQSYLANSRQKPTLQFCVPEEWYLRPRALLPFSVQPSEDTLKRFENIQAESDDAEGTAKQKKSTLDALMANASTARPASPDWRGSITSLFAWQQPAPPASPPPSLSKKRMSVSDPVLVEQRTSGSITPVTQSSIPEDEILEVDQAEFERCLDHMALKGDARDKMHILPAAKKRQIIDQARALHSTLDGRTPRPSQSRQSTLEVSGGGAFLPRLVPQLTGDSGILKRLSIWGTSAPVMSPALNRSSGESDKAAETMQPVQAQSTGSMFGNWWASSGGEKNAEAESMISAKRYVDGLRSMKTDARLVKHLISLRVHLSTAKLPWIEEFITEDGMNAIGGALAALVGKGGKRTVFADIESTVLLEIIKCLRVLLNTQAGFDSVLSSPTIITHIAYSFYGASLKTRMLSAELLAAICVLSPNQGHKAVIAASSEYRIAYDEVYRFEFLVAALRISDQSDTAANNTSSQDEDGIWEARTAFMALVNALTNCPESLEDRILSREEFGRRGLNEVIVTLRYTKPPDSLLTQLDLYTEEKYEDEEDLRERTRNAVRGGQGHGRERSESDIFLDDLLQSANNAGLGSISMSILHHLSSIMKSDAELSNRNVKVDQLAIVDTFLDQIFTADDIDLGWIPLITRFLDAIRPITGQDISIDAVDGGTKRELESLRVQIDDLIQTKSALKTRLEQRTGSNHQKPNTSSKGGNENKLVQRLMQKEKEVHPTTGRNLSA